MRTVLTETQHKELSFRAYFGEQVKPVQGLSHVGAMPVLENSKHLTVLKGRSVCLNAC